MAVLLSIRPEFSDAIWSGEKKFEYRRRIFDTVRYNEAYVYTTAPISLVTGRFFVEDLIVGSPEQVWKATMDFAGIDEDRFLTYFGGRRVAFAIAIGAFEKFRHPLALTKSFGLKSPPQSYAFVDTLLDKDHHPRMSTELA